MFYKHKYVFIFQSQDLNTLNYYKLKILKNVYMTHVVNCEVHDLYIYMSSLFFMWYNDWSICSIVCLNKLNMFQNIINCKC